MEILNEGYAILPDSVIEKYGKAAIRALNRPMTVGYPGVYSEGVLKIIYLAEKLAKEAGAEKMMVHHLEKALEMIKNGEV